LPVNNCATNTQNGQKKIKSKICTIIFSINNSFKINGMIQLFDLTEEISRFTVGTLLDTQWRLMMDQLCDRILKWREKFKNFNISIYTNT